MGKLGIVHRNDDADEGSVAKRGEARPQGPQPFFLGRMILRPDGIVALVGRNRMIPGRRSRSHWTQATLAVRRLETGELKVHRRGASSGGDRLGMATVGISEHTGVHLTPRFPVGKPGATTTAQLNYCATVPVDQPNIAAPFEVAIRLMPAFPHYSSRTSLVQKSSLGSSCESSAIEVTPPYWCEATMGNSLPHRRCKTFVSALPRWAVNLYECRTCSS